MGDGRYKLEFPHPNVVSEITLWNSLCDALALIQLNDDKHVFKWDIHRFRTFTACAMYKAVITLGIFETSIHLSKVKISPWYLFRRIVLNKHNLVGKTRLRTSFVHFADRRDHSTYFRDCNFAQINWLPTRLLVN